jgi:hypothetical protein
VAQDNAEIGERVSITVLPSTEPEYLGQYSAYAKGLAATKSEFDSQEE